MSPSKPGSRSPSREPTGTAADFPPSEDLRLREKLQFKYGASVLARAADFEGWTDNELTIALNDFAAKQSPSECKPTPVNSTDSSKMMDSERMLRLQKRQQTVRIARQADMEGWSDEKLVAALRLRNSIHFELRNRVPCVESL